jgi:transcription antitermination protein NusB
MSSYRTQGRCLALQILFAEEFQGLSEASVSEVMAIAAPKAPSEVKSFAEDLISGVLQQKEILDERLSEASEHWQIDRIHPVEKEILRIGLFEIAYRPDVPARVSIGEAVELARRYGDDDAWRLVNGILDELAKGRLGAEEQGDAPSASAPE